MNTLTYHFKVITQPKSYLSYRHTCTENGNAVSKFPESWKSCNPQKEGYEKMAGKPGNFPLRINPNLV